MTYLDHNAATPVDPRVLERFLEVERTCPGHPGSLHAAGRRARAVLEDARAAVATALGVDADEVVFVSGGTEANNLAVLGAGDPALPVLLAPLEHPSVLRAAEQRGAVWWEVTPHGCARPEPPLGPVGLVCLVHAQNETGAVQPLGEASRVARAAGAPLHVDLSQSLGRLPVGEPIALASTLTISAHKAGGLRGASVLLARARERLRPMLLGGGQEAGLRAGTQSPALAAATALAIELAVREQEARARATAAAAAAFEAALDAGVRYRRLTPPDSLPNTLMLYFTAVDGRHLLPALDLAGIAASQGSACSTGAPEPPRVLAAMGIADEDARRCVRFSFGTHDTPDEARDASRRVAEVVLRLQRTAATRSL